MSQRIRGQECTAQIIVDGDLKGGTFVKMTNFEVTPRTDVTETDFLGELLSDLDIIHHGFDFSGEFEHQDAKVLQLVTLITDRERLRLPHPDINIVVTFRYRSLTEIPAIIVLEHCFVKVDNIGIGGRKEYVKSKLSGKCKTCPELL